MEKGWIDKNISIENNSFEPTKVVGLKNRVIIFEGLTEKENIEFQKLGQKTLNKITQKQYDRYLELLGKTLEALKNKVQKL